MWKTLTSAAYTWEATTERHNGVLCEEKRGRNPTVGTFQESAALLKQL